MDDLSFLRPKLSRLKLSGIMETLPLRLEQAMKEKWSFSQFLDLLLTDEVERRDFKQLARRLVKSAFDLEKTLETFDFTFNPQIHQPTIRELATCRFLEKRENVFLLGPSGVGKSHLAQALSYEACKRGYEVMFRRTGALFGWIHSGRGDGTHERRLKQLCSIPLLILDDFRLKTLTEDGQADLYELICMRYEKHRTIITSNRDFNEWPMVFTNPLMRSTAMDRLVHRAVKITIEGKSYRVHNFVQRTKEITAEAAERKNL
ncbi:MAG: IS21-like element helper ATPase IstB [Candidatus Jordarchaeum sp.]|uniref:IS21-like element helper ATPase IstB n=1 Tax=Candidatus Jordarchaeum sp. TaxID=2823881 RepID=UPI00404B3004